MRASEFEQILTRFLESAISIEEMEETLVPLMASLMRDPDSDEADLLATTELGLAEYSRGAMDENDLQNTPSVLWVRARRPSASLAQF